MTLFSHATDNTTSTLGRYHDTSTQNPYLASTRWNGPICLKFGVCLVGVGRVSGMCLEDITRVSGGGLESVYMMYKLCLEDKSGQVK